MKDNRQEILSISLPFELHGKAMLFDQLGSKKTFDRIKHEQNKTIVTDIELNGGRIVIIKIE